MSTRTGEAIQSCIAAAFDGFVRVDAKPGFCYRQHTPPFYAFVTVLHSSKSRCFEVDVVSTVFPSWDRQYGTHQLRRATGLPNLRVGSGSMLMEDIAYKYKDAPDQALAVIKDELREFAGAWFAAHRCEMANDRLVQYGLRLMEENSGSTIDLDELKQQLRKEADRIAATKWQRGETAILAIDLLRWRQESQLTRRSS
jgi:hypothetical protein